jgi:translation initiation factor eIF-2B subunit delta
MMDSTASLTAPQKGRSGRRTSEESSGLTSPRPEATPVVNEVSSASAPAGAGGRRPSISHGGKGPKLAPSPTVQSSSKNVSLFAHLPQFDRLAIYAAGANSSISSHLLKGSREAEIHPAIIRLGLAYADYSVIGASERCRQMLLAFKQVSQVKPDY